MQSSLFSLKGHYFYGKFHSFPQQTQDVLQKVCPANSDQILWTMPLHDAPIKAIIDSAQKGFNYMRHLSREERCRLLRAYQKNLMAKKDLLAEAIALESGKPLWESRGEVNAVIGKVDTTIETSLSRIDDRIIDDLMPNTRGRVIHKPLGPCLIIGPFNFPCHLANTQILSALIAGNSIILKPSEKTFYSGQLMIECFHDASFPHGAVNLLQGTGAAASNLLEDPSVKGVFFTGSVAVGKRILKQTSQDLSKLVALELGGKNTAVICDDANYDYALQEMLNACFLTTGQRCVSVSNIALHRSMVDKFIKDFHTLVQKIIIDHPIEYEREPFMGPLIDEDAKEAYLNAMDTAKREGLEEIMKGEAVMRKYKGHYVGPSIHFAKKFDTQSSLLTQELFGPSATLIPFDTLDDAIEIANSTEYGLAVCLFSKREEYYQKCLREIDAGIVNFNRSTCSASAKLPFGGVKNSGNYRPSSAVFIDSCVYQVASLEVLDDSPKKYEEIKGLAF